MRLLTAAITYVAVLLFGSVDAERHRPDTCPSLPHFAEQLCAVGNHDNASPPAPSPPQEYLNHSHSWNDTTLCLQSYCLYTNPSFNNGQGISLITTPSNLRLFKTLTNHLTFPSNPHPPFHIAPIPAKGLGLLSTRPLIRGEPIMSHPPTLLIHRHFLEELTSPKQQTLLNAAVDALPVRTREGFLAQRGHFGGHRVTDILATNAFQTDLGGGGDGEGQHYGNYPPVSRFNHDCRPNVAFYIDERLVHRTRVVRSVAQGEELTISYLDSFASRKERRERALQAWGFGCACEQCSLSEREARKSDGRLEEIARLRGLLEDPGSGGVDGKMVRRYVKLFKDERLDLALAGAYTVAAVNWNMLGEDGMARKYARLAVEAGEIEMGGEAPDVRDMRALERDPRGHYSWRRRVGEGGG